jgi:hypothetical protein
MPSPARARFDRALDLNASCEQCHLDQTAEWRDSLHRRAAVEPAYLRSFAREPLAFCRGCHAPEADPSLPEPPALAALGVGCVSCHLTGDDDTVLASPGYPDIPYRETPHKIRRDARFAGPEACANCHQFRFPGLTHGGPETMMQSTALEHAASADAATPCAGCHMPTSGRRRDHRFTVSRGSVLLRDALTAEARRVSPSRVVLRLTPRHPGHALPTGDLFRRLEVRAEALGGDGLVLGSDARYLTRHFSPRPGGSGRVLVGDTRLRDQPTEIELELPEAAGRPISWSVAYQRVGHPGKAGDEDAMIEGEILLASGSLDP